MQNRSTTTLARRRTAQVLGSVAVLGTVAAVAGMGTFGTFTDSTTPVDSGVDTGVLSVELGSATNYATVPAGSYSLLPGDSAATPFELMNTGTQDWSSVTFKSWATSSSALDTDPANGLQLSLQSCSDPWTVSGPATYACGGTVTDFYSGPVIMEHALPNAVSLVAGRVDHLLATLALPESAGDAKENLTSQINFTFTAVQRDGSAR